jgi:Holliday junction resolvase RusA-like endonuclease
MQTELAMDVPRASKRTRKAAPKNSARAQHKRKASRTPTTATLDIRGMEAGGGLVLVVSDVLTKNDRYGRGQRGTFEKTASKWFKAAVAKAAAAHNFVPPVRLPEIKSGPHKRKASTTYGGKTIRDGLWSLEVLSIWPHERHLEGAAELANGDADAPLSMVRDAMQRAGIIDDDMRIVSDRTLAIYRKDERRTIARLTRLDGPALARHHNAIESLLLAELMADASKPAAC